MIPYGTVPYRTVPYRYLYRTVRYRYTGTQAAMPTVSRTVPYRTVPVLYHIVLYRTVRYAYPTVRSDVILSLLSPVK